MKYILAVILLLSPHTVSASDDESISLFDLEAGWRNQRNEEVAWSSLAGRPMVVCMFFSHCGYACPRITADMQAIANRLGGEAAGRLNFVMASFDTERDTPDALAAFVEAKGIPATWQILHGDEGTVRELAAALGIRYRREPDGNFAHSNLIVLLDAQGRVAFRHEGLGGDLGPITEAARTVADQQ